MILKVRHEHGRERLRAHLRSGHTEIYAPISDAKFRELVEGGHPRDIDTYFSNMIRPSRVLRRPTVRYKLRRVVQFLFYPSLIVTILVLFGLWNSGIIDIYLANLLSRANPVQSGLYPAALK
ncbi:hypothetical protein DTW90_36985 [Neorhizobium sp. P12A]|nr:hypothetical protein DTW90_36985 [Neorhizobium sp. P12A]